MKKSSPPKLPDLRARARCGAPGLAGSSSVSVHGTPGAMVSPMRSARTPRRDTTAPGGFAPRHEDAPDAGFHQRGGDVGERPLDHGSGGFPAETGLRGGDPVRGGRGVDDARPFRAMPAGEGDGLGDVPAVILGKGQRIEGKPGAAA